MATEWKKLPFRFVTPGEVFAVGLVFPLVCIGLTAMRLHVRRIQKQTLGPDDWLAVLGTVMITGMGAIFIVGERMGIMGYPMPVPYGTNPKEAYGLFNDAYITEAKLEFAFQFLQCFGYGFIKASIVFFIRRIFVTHSGNFMNWGSIVLIVIIFVWSFGFLMALIWGCGKDTAIHWAPLKELVASGCDGTTPERANLISDPILDCLILLFPLPTIWALNMSTKKKWAVTGVFAVGIMSVAAAFTRLALHIIVLNQGYGAGYDLNQTVTTIFYWSMVEGGLGGIVANLPTLSFLARDSTWLGKLVRKGSSWASLLKPRSWKSSREQISGQDGSDSHSRAVEPKKSEPSSLDSSFTFNTVPMEHLSSRPTTESTRSQNKLLPNGTQMRPNDSMA